MVELSHDECAPRRPPPKEWLLAARGRRTLPAFDLQEIPVLVVLRTRCGCEQRRYQRGRPTSSRIEVPLRGPRSAIVDEVLDRRRTFLLESTEGDPWTGETWLFVEEEAR